MTFTTLITHKLFTNRIQIGQQPKESKRIIYLKEVLEIKQVIKEVKKIPEESQLSESMDSKY